MQERLKALTDIVWPEIKHLVKCRINQAREEGSVQLILIFMQSCMLDVESWC